MYHDPTLGPPDDMVDAANNYLALRGAILRLADNWERDATSAEGLAERSDNQDDRLDLTSQARLARLSAKALRDLVEEAG